MAGALVGVTACSGGATPDTGRASGDVGSAAVASTTTPAADPVPEAGEEWLAYQDKAYRIRLVRPDGSADHPLDAVANGPEDNPDWSPDGTRLTFVGEGDDPGSNPGLWVIGADGTGLARLVDCTALCQYLDDASWSPDGTRIAYSRQQPDGRHGGRLDVVTVATGRSTTVRSAAPGQFFAGVRWSPDSRWLVFEWVQAKPADYDAVSGVRLATLDLSAKGATPRPLTSPELFAELADWSPRGDRIVYAALPKAGASAHDLFTIRPDGTGRQRLTVLADHGGSATHADFANDGRSVVFVGVDSAAGLAGVLRVQLASRTVSAALGSRVLMANHPRSRPVPQG